MLAPKMQFSTKRLQISKANAQMVGIIAGAVFIAVFSLVSSKALWTQRSYQAKVIGKKEKARDQLQANIEAVSKLATSYQGFVGSSENVLGGNPAGTGDKDGDNAKLVLDALPSKYDFPALTTSLEKLLTEKNFKIGSITGTDDEVAQSKNASSDSPKPIPMAFSVNVTGSYDSVKDLIGTFEKSIRPFSMSTVSFSGNNNSLQLTVTANTYYQPEKALNIRQELVK